MTSKAPGVDEGFLKELDVRLVSILNDLGSGKLLAQIQLAAKQLCQEVTENKAADGSLGNERNKLLEPGWETHWRFEKLFFEGLFWWCDDLLGKDVRSYLVAAFQQLVRFVMDGTTDHIRRDISSDLARALGNYLSLRGFDVTKGDVSAVKKVATERRKPKTERETIRQQRIAFCTPLHLKGEPWTAIYSKYHKKFPNDEHASPATLRLSYNRNPPTK